MSEFSAASLRTHHCRPGQPRLAEATITEALVSLPGWNYPAVIDTESGEVRFDHYEGKWGDPKEMDRLLQAYAVEKTKLEARKKGHAVSEHLLQDGSIRVQIATA